MHPVLLSIGPFKLYSFAFFYNIVIALAAMVMALEMERLKWVVPPVPRLISWTPKSWHRTYYLDALYMALLVMLAGLFGGHLLYGISMSLIDGWGLGLSFYGWIFMFAAKLNGSMWFGAFMGGALLLMHLARTHKKTYLEFIDAAMFSPIIGQIPGRIACFMGGCCFGSPSDLPWAFAQDTKYSLMMFPAGTHLHPSQLYESFIALLIFLYMWLRRKNNTYLGQNLVRYLVLTGIARFITEFARADTPRGVILSWLTVSQVIGVSCAILGTILHFKLSGRKKAAVPVAAA
jgi:phosphatidylglycerol:prolipoprotein diacylglycerol transferase